MTGADLKAWMERREILAPALADLLGVTERTVYRWRVQPDELPRWLDLCLSALDARAVVPRGVAYVDGKRVPW